MYLPIPDFRDGLRVTRVSSDSIFKKLNTIPIGAKLIDFNYRPHPDLSGIFARVSVDVKEIWQFHPCSAGVLLGIVSERMRVFLFKKDCRKGRWSII